MSDLESRIVTDAVLIRLVEQNEIELVYAHLLKEYTFLVYERVHINNSTQFVKGCVEKIFTILHCSFGRWQGIPTQYYPIFRILWTLLVLDLRHHRVIQCFGQSIFFCKLSLCRRTQVGLFYCIDKVYNAYFTIYTTGGCWYY